MRKLALFHFIEARGKLMKHFVVSLN
jgi:hypothetical protein